MFQAHAVVHAGVVYQPVDAAELGYHGLHGLLAFGGLGQFGDYLPGPAARGLNGGYGLLVVGGVAPDNDRDGAFLGQQPADAFADALGPARNDNYLILKL